MKQFLFVYVVCLAAAVIIMVRRGDAETMQDRLQMFRGILIATLAAVMLFLTFKFLNFFFLDNPFL